MKTSVCNFLTSARLHRPLLGWSLLSLSLCLPGYAGKIYTFRDAEGHILVTNMVNQQELPQGTLFSRYRILEKVIYYKDSNIHPYHNWGRNEQALLPGFHANQNRYDAIIREYSQNDGVESGLVKAVIHTESGFNPQARSIPGAQGLMQLMPATARRYHVTNPYDPAENIRGGIEHLGYLLRHFHNLELALAAYNSGEKNVEKYGGIPPFSETQDYVRRVLSRYHHLYANGV